MKLYIRISFFISALALFSGCARFEPPTENSSLSLWNEGLPKESIIRFVDTLTDPNSEHYLAPEERIATFDMDGTILIEKPMYVLFDFALELVHEQIRQNPSLTNSQPYKAVAEKDMDYFHGNVYEQDGLFDLLLYASDGLTDEQYRAALLNYLKKPHSRFDKSPNELLYEPVLQLIDYLQVHDFKVYVCSGSDPEFTRIAASAETGIPPENIIGTMVLSQWTGTDFVRQHEFIKPINDMAGKPVNIRNKIGRIPVIAVGNSRGDLEMLNYSKSAAYSLQLIINHDDPKREYEYSVDKMKKLCAENGWIEVSMKKDFVVIFD